ncbi:hypothetical protein WS70_17630 [Burkholderia mayonis]|uniref:Uncharacterized protein n=1 Tax=Burkholderia mayonis TaxID=1385591 RepID=A0A1B4FJ93_9BURK|nr:hypothetical protein WS70_17630 [Burkholderia mayonis]
MIWPGVVGLITVNDIGPLVDRDLVKQFSQDAAGGNVLVCHQRGAQLAGVRVKRKMHLAPRATLRVAMLMHLPFAFAIVPDACAVDHQMDRRAVPDDCQLDLGRPRAAAHRRVVRHGQGGESLVAQAWRAAPRRARRQAEHALETRQRLNQRIAVEARATAPGLRVGCARTGGFIDPHRDVTSVDQASVVGRPITDAIACLRYARLACVPAHLLGKNRECPQELKLLTEPASGCCAYVRQHASSPAKLCNNAFKNTTQLFSLFALAHLVIAKNLLRSPHEGNPVYA